MRRPQLTHSRQQLVLEYRASAMRQQPTHSEGILWRSLSGSALGVAFRRQVPLGRFIADFVAPSCKLVIEVDGGYHARRVAADRRKDRHLQRLGYRVLRLPDTLVERDLPAALDLIREALRR